MRDSSLALDARL